MTDIFAKYGFFNLPESSKNAEPSWFSYPLSVKESAPFNRSQFARYATSSKIEIRPLMCGNITLQKPFQRVDYKSLDNGRFPIGDEIEEKALFIPCWGMPQNQREQYYSLLKTFLDSYD